MTRSIASLVASVAFATAASGQSLNDRPPILVQGAMTIEVHQLVAHLDHLESASQDDQDELLRDLLVHVYPTKVTQDS